jgi:transposase-like protein
LVNRNSIIEQSPSAVLCSFCGSSIVVKYGFTEKRKQRHLCLKCNHTFLDNDAPRKMRYPTRVIASAIHQFYEGIALHEIRRQLDMNFDVIPHYSSIYDWIFHYTRKAVETLDYVKLRTGDTWIAGETVVRLKSADVKNIRIFDCFDTETGFLLASQLILPQNGKDEMAFIRTIEKRTAGKQPEFLVTDKLESCLHSFHQASISNTSHRKDTSISSPGIKRLRRTLKARTNIISGLSNLESVNLVINGWGIHYNFFRPLTELNGQTPAETARANVTSKSWADIVSDDFQANLDIKERIEQNPDIRSKSESYAGSLSS